MGHLDGLIDHEEFCSLFDVHRCGPVFNHNQRENYKLAIFKCMHKAYNGRLPSTLTNCIAKKRNLSDSIRARDSLLVPRFNTGFMKDSVACRGTVLWNVLSSTFTDLAVTSLCNLVKKLKTSDLFKAAEFNFLILIFISLDC